jgi:uncharacterized protein YndB with AHSA1/START domain
MERRLAHPPSKVWRALTEPTELSQWFPATATKIDLRAGGSIRLDDGDEMPITEVDPPQLLQFSWQGEILRWELRPVDHGCLLVFTHTFDDRAGAASFASGWQLCIDAMEQLLDGEPVVHERPSAELHDAYAAAFGLDSGTMEETADGWRICFERQLTVPAERAWAMLVGSAPQPGGPAPRSLIVALLEAGPVTRAERPGTLEFAWLADGHPAGSVRWELSDDKGTGHGARLTLTQTGPTGLAEQRSAALSAWPGHLQSLADRLRRDVAATS